MPDRPITCVDCGGEFIFTEREQEWYREKGLTNDPKRCKDCRANRKGGGGGEGGGGGGGGGRSHDRGGRGGGGRPRETFKTVCAQCGAECEIPFRPDESRPVYCRDCFQARGKRR